MSCMHGPFGMQKNTLWRVDASGLRRRSTSFYGSWSSSAKVDRKSICEIFVQCVPSVGTTWTNKHSMTGSSVATWRLNGVVSSAKKHEGTHMNDTEHKRSLALVEEKRS